MTNDRRFKTNTLVDSKHVTVLLGANILDAILHADVRRGTQGQPVAVNTAFGWTLTGAVKGFVPPERLHIMLIQRIPTTDHLLNQQLQNWWRADSFGTKYQHESPRTREDKRAIEIFESTVRHVGDCYKAGLLWKEKMCSCAITETSRKSSLNLLKELSNEMPFQQKSTVEK